MTHPRSSARDHRDRVLEHFADQEYALARDLAALREVLHLALAQLHEVTRQLDRFREQHHQLRHEYRRLREEALRDERAAVA